MKLQIFIFFSFLMINISSSYSQLVGSSWSDVKKAGKGELTCVYYEAPGLIQKENGQMTGVCVDVMNEFKDFVQSKYNVELTFSFEKEVSVFTEFIDEVKAADDIMGVCNTSITEKRKAFLDFSPAYMANPSVLLTNQNAETLRSFSEMAETFQGYKAILIKGSTHEIYFKKIAKEFYPDIEIEYVDVGMDVLSKLSSSEKYLTLIDFTEYYDAVKKNLKVKRHPINLDNYKDQLAFIFPNGSDWVTPWQEFLTPAFKESVQYRKIVADNLGSAFVSLIR